MRLMFRATFVCLACVAIGVSLVWSLTTPERRSSMGRTAPRDAPRQAPPQPTEARAAPEPKFPLYGDDRFIDDSGYVLSFTYMEPIRDRSSLEEARAAIAGRGPRGIAQLREELSRPGLARERACEVRINLAALHMGQGEFAEASTLLNEALAIAHSSEMPAGLHSNIRAMLGVAALRRGETDNCVSCLGPSSCILPIAPEAVHLFPSGSREAIGHFAAYLHDRPEDVGVRWLLNIAYMTLGEYPDKVPPADLIALDLRRPAPDVGRFLNVASEVGLGVRGANMAGGSIFDDFDGDGLPDVFTSSFDHDLGASLFLNRGDGTFADHSESAGLKGQVLAINCTQTDYDNDGDLDVMLLRGGWESPYRLSLLRNRGDATFEDVTVAAGLAEPIASHSAAWGDYDNDGFLDVFVCGEYSDRQVAGLSYNDATKTRTDPRNHCRLYRNLGDGTFINVAAEAGVLNERFAKGAVWGDYDDDGWPDLFVSNRSVGNRLYHNNGDGSFTDLAPRLGVTEPTLPFACWFWDYDNDGRLDIYVNGFQATLNETIDDTLGRSAPKAIRPRLYRNVGPDGFRDVTAEAGLDRVWLAMGSNFGDIDEDGFLDFYLGTGRPAYSYLVPNVLMRNVGGRRFEDVTVASGTGHLQKGHGVSFADYDGDGDLDLFAELGGAILGDRAHNALFRNPGHGRHWLKVKLVGTKTNRAAIGAKVRVDLVGAGGEPRSVHRVIGPGSSYGGSSLVATIGLGDAGAVSTLTVTWPTSGTRQVFRDLPIDQAIQVTEGADDYRVIPRPTPLADQQGPATVQRGQTSN
jgi:hypothetical protein